MQRVSVERAMRRILSVWPVKTECIHFANSNASSKLMDEEQTATGNQSKLSYLQCLILVLSIYVLAALFIQESSCYRPKQTSYWTKSISASASSSFMTSSSGCIVRIQKHRSWDGDGSISFQAFRCLTSLGGDVSSESFESLEYSARFVRRKYLFITYSGIVPKVRLRLWHWYPSC